MIYKGFALLLGSVLPRLSKYLEVKYVVADGSYGNKTSCIIAQEHGLELISKLNKRTGLYLPYDEGEEEEESMVKRLITITYLRKTW